MGAVMVRRLAIVSLLAALLTACGGSATGEWSEFPTTPASAPTAAQAESTAPEPSPTPTGPKKKVVVLDPGHGGDEIGAAAFSVTEKESNLDFALRVEKLLLA